MIAHELQANTSKVVGLLPSLPWFLIRWTKLTISFYTYCAWSQLFMIPLISRILGVTPLIQQRLFFRIVSPIYYRNSFIYHGKTYSEIQAIAGVFLLQYFQCKWPTETTSFQFNIELTAHFWVRREKINWSDGNLIWKGFWYSKFLNTLCPEQLDVKTQHTETNGPISSISCAT